jgi:hypothetical protein
MLAIGPPDQARLPRGKALGSILAPSLSDIAMPCARQCGQIVAMTHRALAPVKGLRPAILAVQLEQIEGVQEDLMM